MEGAGGALQEFEDAEWTNLGDRSFRCVDLFDMEWDDTVNLQECITAAAPFGGPIALARPPHALTQLGEGNLDDVRIFSASGVALGVASPSDDTMAGAGNVFSLHWSSSESLVVVREQGVVDVYDMHGNRQGAPFHLGYKGDGRHVQHAAMSGQTLAAVTQPGVLGGGAAESLGGRELVVIPNIRAPLMRSATELGTSQSTAPVCIALVPGQHTASGHPDVLLSCQDSSLRVASSPHYSPEVRQTMKVPVQCMAVSPSGQSIAMYDEAGSLFLRTGGSITQMKDVVPGATVEATLPQQVLWVGGSPPRDSTASALHADFAIALVWSGDASGADSQVVLVDPLTGQVGRLEDLSTFDGAVAVQEVDGLRVLTSLEHFLVQQVPPSVQSVLSLVSQDGARLLRDAAAAFAERDARCDDDIRYLQQEGTLHAAVLDCIDAALGQWSPLRQQELLRAASYGKRFDPAFSAPALVGAVKTLRTLNQLRDPDVGMPLTARQFDVLSPETIVGRLLLRRQHALALALCEYWPLPAVRARVVEHWACSKIRKEAASRSHTVITDEISARLRLARRDQCPYSNGAYAALSGGGEAPGLSVSFADMAAAAQSVGQRPLATALLQLEPRAAEQVPLLLRMGAGPQALSRALQSQDMDLVFMSLLHLKDTMSEAAPITTEEGEVVSGEEQFIRLTLRSDRAAKLLVRYATHQNPDLAARVHSTRSDYMQAARASLIMAFDQPPCAEDPDDRLRESVLRREAGEVPGGTAAALAEDAGISNAAEVLQMGVASGQRSLGFFAGAAGRAEKLREVQRRILDKHDLDVVGGSVVDTLAALITREDDRMLAKVKGDFKVSDRLFAFTKLRTLAALGNWPAVVAWAKSRRSHAIPWKAFVDCAVSHFAGDAVGELAEKLEDEEEAFDALMTVGKFLEAAGVAAKLKDGPRLQAVGAATSAPAVQSKVRAALAAL